MNTKYDFDNKIVTTYPSIERWEEQEWQAFLEWQWTEKIDGTNIQIEFHPEISESIIGHPENARRVSKFSQITIGGRTTAAQIPTGIVDYLKAYVDKQALEEVFGWKGAIIFGEGYGEKIQNGQDYLLPDDPFRQKFIVFDIAIRGENDFLYWLSRDNVIGICERLKLDVVPLIDRKSYSDVYDIVEEGFKSKLGNGTKDAEGVVGRPKVPLFDAKHRRLIVKLTTDYIRSPSKHLWKKKDKSE
jgi:hypothetical protein